MFRRKASSRMAPIQVSEDEAEMAGTEMNQSKILEIQSAWLPKSEALVRSNRLFVREGQLKKLSRRGLAVRQFFLFNDVLVYGTPLTKGTYTNQHVLALAEMSLAELDEMECDGAFGLQINHTIKSFQVACPTAADRKIWARDLRKCIHRASGRDPGAVLATSRAVWVPDAQVATCMACCVTTFSMTKRRHHCRRCGKVVCGPCSNQKAKLGLGKLERVCLPCFLELKASQRGNRAAGEDEDDEADSRTFYDSDGSDCEGGDGEHGRRPGEQLDDLSTEQRLRLLTLLSNGQELADALGTLSLEMSLNRNTKPSSLSGSIKRPRMPPPREDPKAKQPFYEVIPELPAEGAHGRCDESHYYALVEGAEAVDSLAGEADGAGDAPGPEYLEVAAEESAGGRAATPEEAEAVTVVKPAGKLPLYNVLTSPTKADQKGSSPPPPRPPARQRKAPDPPSA